MDYLGLEKSLERQVISSIYLFYGEETYLMNEYLEKFKSLIPLELRDFSMDIVDGRDTSLEAIVNMVTTIPFMSDRRLVIVKNAEFFKSRRKTDDSEDKNGPGEDALLEYLENPLDSSCLIFCADAIDKKRKLYKRIEKNGQVVEFSPLKGHELNEWVDRKARNLGKIIEPAALAGLLTAVGNNLQQIKTELEKLACHSQNEKITSSDVELMVSKTAELSVFELVDAVGERNYKKAIRMAREMVFLGEPVIRLLFMVARQFRLIIKAKDLNQRGYLDKQVAGQLQVHPFVAQKCVKQARNFSVEELKIAMERILSTDADIKNGRQEPMLALELLIVALCEKS